MSMKSPRSWHYLTVIMALIVGVAGTAVARYGSRVEAADARPRAVKSVRLYVFNLGNVQISDSRVLFAERLDVALNGCCIVVGYLIVHPKGTLMWDVGVVPDDQLASGAQRDQNVGSVIVEPPKRSLKDQLAEIGYSPKDITYFALSHLHFDHVANANAFQGSTWIVQQAERDAMFADTPSGNRSRSYYSALKNSRTIILANMSTMDEYDVFGDRTVVIKPAPGHTPGHQVLIVTLPKMGPVMLAGDLYHFREERTAQVLPRIDSEQSRASRTAIEEYVKKRAIPLWIEHDTRLYETLKHSPHYIE